MSSSYIVYNIRSLCAKQGLTFQQLEKETGIGNGTIARWDRQSPRVGNLIKVANYFGVTLNRLVKPAKGDVTDGN